MSLLTRESTGPSPARENHPTLLHAFFARAVDRWPERVAVDVPPGERPRGPPDPDVSRARSPLREPGPAAPRVGRGRVRRRDPRRAGLGGPLRGAARRAQGRGRLHVHRPVVSGRSFRRDPAGFRGGRADHRRARTRQGPPPGLRPGARVRSRRAGPLAEPRGRGRTSGSRSRWAGAGEARLRDLYLGDDRASQGGPDRAWKHREPRGVRPGRVSTHARGPGRAGVVSLL